MPKGRDVLLGRYGPHKTEPIFRLLPGHGGPRPALSFVLNTLAGNDGGMLRFHLSLTKNLLRTEQQTFRLIINSANKRESIRASMIATMRLLADLWINSGKSDLNASFDDPSTRNVEYVPEGERGPIRALFYNLIGNLVHYPAIRSDGTQGTQESYFGMQSEDFGWRSAGEVAVRFGDKVAMYWFARLLDSPYSRHLARCDGCAAYFAYDRAPKAAIKSGVFCRNCKGRGSAQRTRRSRAFAHLRMIDAAANAWGQWKRSSANPSQRDWVAARVSRELRAEGKPPITPKWVSQNISAIEAAIQKRNHAKG